MSRVREEPEPRLLRAKEGGLMPKYELSFTVEVPDENGSELAYEAAFAALADLLGSESVDGGAPLKKLAWPGPVIVGL